MEKPQHVKTIEKTHSQTERVSLLKEKSREVSPALSVERVSHTNSISVFQ